MLNDFFAGSLNLGLSHCIWYPATARERSLPLDLGMLLEKNMTSKDTKDH
jgi:hypothetical protein